MIRTFQYRIKDSCAAKHLAAHARAVNFCWNFCNDTQKHALRWNKKWPSGFDLSHLCAGASKELGLHSQTIQAVCERYAQSRSAKQRPYLRYRGKKHLGWIPFKARAIHAKIANRRKDHLHKLSTTLVKEYGFISIGKINSAQLARTAMAKSVLDAGWSTFTTLLGYKAIAHRAMVVEVEERFTTQDCSACGARSGPKGLKDLGIREWVCCGCGAVHDRDRNAAKNILRRGRATLAEGISVLAAQVAAAG